VVEAPFWFSDKPEDHKAAYDAADEASYEGFRHRFHQLLYGEVETTDRMGKMLAEFPQLPWEMRLELAHQMWDEARHTSRSSSAGAARRSPASRASTPATSTKAPTT
jgi:hypothetical protein